MKKALLLIILLSPFSLLFSQPVRLHLLGGFSNYGGDIQDYPFSLKNASLAVSYGGTFELNERISVRSDYTFTNLRGDDKRNIKRGLRERNLNFATHISELTLLGEYNLLNLAKNDFTPYIYGGIGAFVFNPYTIVDDKKVFLKDLNTEGQGLAEYPNRKPYKSTQINIPFGGGVKYALSDEIQLRCEVSFRKLFTDYLDDVSSTYADKDLLFANKGQLAVDLAFRGDELKDNPQTYPAEGSPRGNPAKNDRYYFLEAGISIRMNWFSKDKFETLYSNRKRKRMGCPNYVF